MLAVYNMKAGNLNMCTFTIHVIGMNRWKAIIWKSWKPNAYWTVKHISDQWLSSYENYMLLLKIDIHVYINKLWTNGIISLGKKKMEIFKTCNLKLTALVVKIDKACFIFKLLPPNNQLRDNFAYLNIKIWQIKCSSKQGAEMGNAWDFPPRP